MEAIESIAFLSGFALLILIIIYGSIYKPKKSSRPKSEGVPEIFSIVLIMVLAIFIASVLFSLLFEFFKTTHYEK